jgi:hypothetical protein
MTKTAKFNYEGSRGSVDSTGFVLWSGMGAHISDLRGPIVPIALAKMVKSGWAEMDTISQGDLRV